MRVSSLFFDRFFETRLSLKTPSGIHLSRSTSNSFGVHGNGGGVSYSLPFDFLFLSPVDAAMACGVVFLSLGLSELGLTDWVVFLAFCNNCANLQNSSIFHNQVTYTHFHQYIFLTMIIAVKSYVPILNR